MHVRVCDVCGAREDIRRYRVIFAEEGNKRLSIDLCPDDAAPLEALREHVPGGPGGRPTKRVVTTKDEIRSSHTRKRPTKKSAGRKS